MISATFECGPNWPVASIDTRRLTGVAVRYRVSPRRDDRPGGVGVAGATNGRGLG